MEKKLKKYSRNEHAKEILSAIAKIGIVATLAIMPQLGAVGYILKMLDSDFGYQSRARTKKTFESLKKKRLIYYNATNKKVTIRLTEKGKLYYKKICIDSMKLPVYKKWNHLWHIVTFDIPESNRVNRKHFAKTLELLGFYGLEKSMYVYPYECQKEIKEIGEIFSVSKYVRYITASYLSKDEFVKHFFNL